MLDRDAPAWLASRELIVPSKMRIIDVPLSGYKSGYGDYSTGVAGILTTRLTTRLENRDSLLTHCDTREAVYKVPSVLCQVLKSKTVHVHDQRADTNVDQLNR